MENENFDSDKIIQYWIDSSDDDFDTMMVMFETKRFNWALFVGHLMIEKLLKALYIKTNNEFPPLIHNLLRLASTCKLQLDKEQELFFITVTAFNINTRYDDYKMSFQKACTPIFTAEWIDKLKTNRLWIKKLLAS